GRAQARGPWLGAAAEGRQGPDAIGATRGVDPKSGGGPRCDSVTGTRAWVDHRITASRFTRSSRPGYLPAGSTPSARKLWPHPAARGVLFALVRQLSLAPFCFRRLVLMTDAALARAG